MMGLGRSEGPQRPEVWPVSKVGRINKKQIRVSCIDTNLSVLLCVVESDAVSFVHALDIDEGF